MKRIPKKNAKDCSNYCTAFISHTNKIVLIILQGKCQKYMNCKLPDVQAGFRIGRGPEMGLPTSTGSSKKQENSRKAYTSSSLTALKLLLVESQQTVEKP